VHYNGDSRVKARSAIMDIEQLLQQLHADMERLKRAIACLEQLRGTPLATDGLPGKKQRRGRTSMGAEERLEVSARMKKYWAGRKRQR